MSNPNEEDPIMHEFLSQPTATQQIYLIKNHDDVRKAAEAFHKNKSDKYNIYYAGGSKSGVAVIGPGDDCCESATPIKRQEPAKSAYSGCGHSLSSSKLTEKQNSGITVLKKKTDYSGIGQPKTRIKFTFGNNQFLILTVDLSTTISDLKSHVIENVSGIEGKSIHMTIMGRELSNDNSTVEAEGLKMSNVQCTFQ